MKFKFLSEKVLLRLFICSFLLMVVILFLNGYLWHLEESGIHVILLDHIFQFLVFFNAIAFSCAVIYFILGKKHIVKKQKPLREAIEQNDYLTVKKLISHPLVRFETNSYSPLHDAAERGHLKICKLLIENGADVNAKNGEDYTAMQLATSPKHFDICELLIKHDNNVNAINTFLQSIVNYPYSKSRKKHTEMCKLLIEEHGADVNKAIPNYRSSLEVFHTLLECAAYHGHLGICELLIKHGANVNTKNDKGLTPLHRVAAQRKKTTLKKHIKICELLLKHGADVNAKNNDGNTPIFYADGEISEILKKHG